MQVYLQRISGFLKFLNKILSHPILRFADHGCFRTTTAVEQLNNGRLNTTFIHMLPFVRAVIVSKTVELALRYVNQGHHLSLYVQIHIWIVKKTEHHLSVSIFLNG